MTSSDIVLQLVEARESAFREYYANFDYISREKPQPVSSWGIPQREAATTRALLPYSDYMTGLYRTSSQLKPKLLHEFINKHPVTELLLENKGEAAPYEKSRYWESDYETRNAEERSKKFGGYSAKADAALMISEIDSTIMAGGTGDVFNPSGHSENDPEAKKEELGETTTKGNKVPTLLSLARRSAQPLILQRALELEQSFVDDLHVMRGVADESFQRALHKAQAELQNSPEAQEVKRLRELLHRAEQDLEKRHREGEKPIEEERNAIQAKYDRERAAAVASYFEKRNTFLDEFASCYEYSVCLECSHTFTPKPREVLPGWSRCSIVSCASSERFCEGCCCEPCKRCFSPLCGAHRAAHDLACRSEISGCCGFDKHAKTMALGMANGCCGSKEYFLLDRCKVCGVKVCGDCEYRDEPRMPPDFDSERYIDEPWTAPKPKKPYCPKCSEGKTMETADDSSDSDKTNKSRPIKWSQPEYVASRQKRKRANTKSTRLPPIEAYLVSSDAWQEQQRRTHEQWAKRRLLNTSQDEFRYIQKCYEDKREHRVEAIYEEHAESEADDVISLDTICETAQTVESLPFEKFQTWMKENAVEQSTVQSFLAEFTEEEIRRNGVVPENACPCERCKRSKLRADLDRKKKRKRYDVG